MSKEIKSEKKFNTVIKNICEHPDYITAKQEGKIRSHFLPICESLYLLGANPILTRDITVNNKWVLPTVMFSSEDELAQSIKSYIENFKHKACDASWIVERHFGFKKVWVIHCRNDKSFHCPPSSEEEVDNMYQHLNEHLESIGRALSTSR